MRSFAAMIAVMGALIAPSQASAWVCRADGFGAQGYGRSLSVAQARLIALRECQFRSLLHACALISCRP
ncbi:MAG TPA: hypothetical protein VH684_13195 [Xanthobacteraceae bacterium]|jgi:hypothetical protein